jgi:hypothetical protein
MEYGVVQYGAVWSIVVYGVLGADGRRCTYYCTTVQLVACCLLVVRLIVDKCKVTIR